MIERMGIVVLITRVFKMYNTRPRGKNCYKAGGHIIDCISETVKMGQ